MLFCSDTVRFCKGFPCLQQLAKQSKNIQQHSCDNINYRNNNVFRRHTKITEDSNSKQ